MYKEKKIKRLIPLSKAEQKKIKGGNDSSIIVADVTEF